MKSIKTGMMTKLYQSERTNHSQKGGIITTRGKGLGDVINTVGTLTALKDPVKWEFYIYNSRYTQNSILDTSPWAREFIPKTLPINTSNKILGEYNDRTKYFDPSIISDFPTELYAPKSIQNQINKIFHKELNAITTISQQKPIIYICPNIKKEQPAMTWSTENWITFLNRISFEYFIVILPSFREDNISEIIGRNYNNINFDTKVKNNKTLKTNFYLSPIPFIALINTLSQHDKNISSLYIGNDSAPIHIISAAQKEALAITVNLWDEKGNGMYTPHNEGIAFSREWCSSITDPERVAATLSNMITKKIKDMSYL